MLSHVVFQAQGLNRCTKVQKHTVVAHAPQTTQITRSCYVRLSPYGRVEARVSAGLVNLYCGLEARRSLCFFNFFFTYFYTI